MICSSDIFCLLGLLANCCCCEVCWLVEVAASEDPPAAGAAEFCEWCCFLLLEEVECLLDDRGFRPPLLLPIWKELPTPLSSHPGEEGVKVAPWWYLADVLGDINCVETLVDAKEEEEGWWWWFDFSFIDLCDLGVPGIWAWRENTGDDTWKQYWKWNSSLIIN